MTLDHSIHRLEHSLPIPRPKLPASLWAWQSDERD